MDSFTTHTGIGVPLRRSNVDTDQIIPAVYLKRVTRTGFDIYKHQVYIATDEGNFPGSVFRMEGCYLHDANGGIQFVNRAWEELWGVPREALRGYNILQDAQLDRKGLLPSIRDAFGQTLGQFVQEHFLNADTITERVRGVGVAARASAWVLERDAAGAVGPPCAQSRRAPRQLAPGSSAPPPTPGPCRARSQGRRTTPPCPGAPPRSRNAA